jgi:penicillin-binding protein 2
MFERRLKVFLGVLLLMTVTLVLRAAQVQVLQHTMWEGRAVDAMSRREQVETRRGAIRDMKGVVIAEDEPCVDACVDYRALAPDPQDKAWVQWVTDLARGRLKDRLGAAYTEAPRDQRQVMLDAEIEAVRKDMRELIPRLAKVTGREELPIENLRVAIVEKVRMRQRFLWYRSYELALRKHETGVQQAQTQPSSVWQKWLLDDAGEVPELDQFELRVAEETAKHVLVRDVELDVQAELGKHILRFPGLELRPGMRRIYPLGGVAAHLLGRMTRVTKEDRDTDPHRTDELRQYQQTDLKGRGGLEGLAEPVLRGVRGEIAKVEGREVAMKPPQPGRDVYTSIDVGLQEQVEALFQAVPIKVPDRKDPDLVKMHGAAVVIDVATGELRVLASAPGFDPNTIDENYSAWTDPLNLDQPLLNRATLAVREPGSTVKPIVGMAGVAAGVRGAHDGYECTGYMSVNGRTYRTGRCWVNSMFHKVLCKPDCKLLPCPTVAHHVVPYDARHPTGFLTLADALERSCNPYFESIAHALGPVPLSDWYRKFGMGVRTHIGIAESAGRLPDDYSHVVRGPNSMLSTWSAGIGQGPVGATPLQMANVAATIARGGVWRRPTLLRLNPPEADRARGGGQFDVPPTTQAAGEVDLGIPPAALAAVREGMFKVVHTEAGSGVAARRPDVAVAGKTGTAEAAKVFVQVRDEKTGKVLKDEKDRPVRRELAMSTHDAPNTEARWYRATGRAGDAPHHSWFIGYAPAENPQIAFAVMVEYGGSGGGAAGSVASKIVELCIAHGHLKVPPKPANVAAAPAAPAPQAGSPMPAAANEPASVAPLAPAAEVELLRDLPATTRAAN